ncbi:MAG: methyl-accepting chemotaxis protein, partial [Aeromonas sp.]
AFQIARTSIIAAILACAALVVLFATVLTRQIRNPLVMLTNQASRIADGHLGRGELCDWIAEGRLNKDEIGQLGQAIQRMKNGLGDLVSEISSSVTQLGSAVEEVSAISTQSSQGMSQQQGQITQVATAMQQMQTTVEDVARNTTQAAEMARSAFNASRQGQQVVVSAIDSLEKMAGEIEGTGQVVSQLESESNNISLVLDVIRNIADQTNLLALNAAIEAARAGEQGRGFAVVADEVRTLAQRTQDSTTEIQRMIEQLQSRASAAGSAMQEGCQSMLETVSLARGAGEQMEQVNDAVTAISDMNTQIASATEEQHQVAEELGRNMLVINTVAEENAQGANHTAQSCHELARLAQHLQQRISRFSLA